MRFTRILKPILAGMLAIAFSVGAVTPASAATRPAVASASVRLIEVDLSQQRVYLKANGRTVDTWLISSGKAGTPTPTGHYKVRYHVRSQTMRGRGYVVPNVQWVMYFNGGYAFHGVYWHHNWGHRMSHGCVGMSNTRAAQLYRWAPNGTSVWIHP